MNPKPGSGPSPITSKPAPSRSSTSTTTFSPCAGIPPFCVTLPPPPPPSGGGGGGGGAVVTSSDPPRGLWCNTLGILTLPGGFLVGPLNAVNLYIFQGKVLEAAGLVSAADWAPGVG